MRTIDPYYEWLGIPPKDQPPNHYRLLGLEFFEQNRSVIDTAANRQMSFIKTYQTGPPETEELSQRILNELAAARLCLLNPEKKSGYDAQLRAQLAVEQAGGAIVPAQESIVLDPLESKGLFEPGGREAVRPLPMASPVSEAPVLPPMTRGKPLTPSATHLPRAVATSSRRGTARKPAVVLPSFHLPENHLIAIAIGAGAGCLLLAFSLIIWFAVRSKPPLARDRQTAVLATSSTQLAERPETTASIGIDPASPTAIESAKPSPSQPDAQTGVTGADISSKPVEPLELSVQLERPGISNPVPSAPHATVDVEPPRGWAVTHELAEPVLVQQPLNGPVATPVVQSRPEPAADTATVPVEESETPAASTVAPESATADPGGERHGEIELLIGEAQQLIDRRDYEDAEKRLLQVNLIQRDHPQMCFYLGLLAALVEHDVADARRYFGRAKSSGTQDVNCLNNLGIIAVRSRDASQAIRNWKEALEIDPVPEVRHNIQLLLSLADRDRVSVSSGARESIADVLQALSLSGKLDEGNSPGRGSSPRYRGSSRGWLYMDYTDAPSGSASWHWPDLSDRSCMQCNGVETADCPTSGCSRGRIRVSTFDLIPTGRGTIIKKQRLVVVVCTTCRGTGRVSCPFCTGGIDRDL